MARKYTRKQSQADTPDFVIGQDNPRLMKSTGPAEIEDPVIEVVDGPRWRDKAAVEAFMAEEVEVIVHESNDKNAFPVIHTAVNGRNQYFVRGMKQRVKRMFLGSLARAKRTTFTQREVVNANGDRDIVNVPHTALSYPFSVLDDRNPNGRAWLEKTLREA